MEIVRGKKPKSLKVKVGGLDAGEVPSLANRADDSGRGGRLGLVVESVPAEQLEDYGIKLNMIVPVTVKKPIVSNCTTSS